MIGQPERKYIDRRRRLTDTDITPDEEHIRRAGVLEKYKALLFAETGLKEDSMVYGGFLDIEQKFGAEMAEQVYVDALTKALPGVPLSDAAQLLPKEAFGRISRELDGTVNYILPSDKYNRLFNRLAPDSDTIGGESEQTPSIPLPAAEVAQILAAERLTYVNALSHYVFNESLQDRAHSEEAYEQVFERARSLAAIIIEAKQGGDPKKVREAVEKSVAAIFATPYDVSRNGIADVFGDDPSSNCESRAKAVAVVMHEAGFDAWDDIYYQKFSDHIRVLAYVPTEISNEPQLYILEGKRLVLAKPEDLETTSIQPLAVAINSDYTRFTPPTQEITYPGDFSNSSSIFSSGISNYIGDFSKLYDMLGKFTTEGKNDTLRFWQATNDTRGKTSLNDAPKDFWADRFIMNFKDNFERRRALLLEAEPAADTKSEKGKYHGSIRELVNIGSHIKAGLEKVPGVKEGLDYVIQREERSVEAVSGEARAKPYGTGGSLAELLATAETRVKKNIRKGLLYGGVLSGIGIVGNEAYNKVKEQIDLAYAYHDAVQNDATRFSSPDTVFMVELAQRESRQQMSLEMAKKIGFTELEYRAFTTYYTSVDLALDSRMADEHTLALPGDGVSKIFLRFSPTEQTISPSVVHVLERYSRTLPDGEVLTVQVQGNLEVVDQDGIEKVFNKNDFDRPYQIEYIQSTEQ